MNRVYTESGLTFDFSRWKKFSEGYAFSKPIVALLIMKLDKLNTKQRQRLFSKIAGYIPTSLNDKKFAKFSSIEFDMPKISDMEKYSLTVASIPESDIEIAGDAVRLGEKVESLELGDRQHS
ncbi:MAG: hypothetical protein LBI74_08515 [Synergistaceae bacterium]|jgi:hypothetical protein|nr:hypothetical protein [Synergistaceae bacterium]